MAATRPAKTAPPRPTRGSSQTASVPISATTAATDRSMPPIKITSVMPKASTALIEICWARCSRLSSERNCGTQIRNTARSKTMAARSGATYLTVLMIAQLRVSSAMTSSAVVSEARTS